MSDNYSVYMHTSPTNMVYVGITSQNPKRRWNSGYGYIHNSFFNNAIKKYGWNNFKHEVLCEGLSGDEARTIEVSLIKTLKATDRNFGYNLANGGETSVTGKKWTEERKKSQSLKMKGKNVGKYVGAKSKKAKKICQYDLEGNFIKEWGSSTDIARAYSVDYTNIIKCCTGVYKKSKGYIWIYKGDNEQLEKSLEKNKEIKKLSKEHKERISKGMLLFRKKEREKTNG